MIVPLAMIRLTLTTCLFPPPSVPLAGLTRSPAELAVAVQEKETPPVLAMVNCVCAPKQKVKMMLVG